MIGTGHVPPGRNGLAHRGGSEALIPARIEEIENAIKGKEVWLVVYRAVVPPGQKVFHTHAIVFLDAKTGDVLPIKHQEE